MSGQGVTRTEKPSTVDSDSQISMSLPKVLLSRAADSSPILPARGVRERSKQEGEPAASLCLCSGLQALYLKNEGIVLVGVQGPTQFL